MADHLLKARQSNAEARKRHERIRQREQAPDDDDDDGLDRDTLREIVAEEFAKRPPMDSASLEIDVAQKRSLLKAPPWVVALAVVGVVVVTWLLAR